MVLTRKYNFKHLTPTWISDLLKAGLDPHQVVGVEALLDQQKLSLSSVISGIQNPTALMQERAAFQSAFNKYGSLLLNQTAEKEESEEMRQVLIFHLRTALNSVQEDMDEIAAVEYALTTKKTRDARSKVAAIKLDQLLKRDRSKPLSLDDL